MRFNTVHTDTIDTCALHTSVAPGGREGLTKQGKDRQEEGGGRGGGS